jgi:hypothetical protein
MKKIIVAVMILNLSTAFAASKKCASEIENFGDAKVHYSKAFDASNIEAATTITAQIERGIVIDDIGEAIKQRIKLLMAVHEPVLKAARAKALSACK